MTRIPTAGNGCQDKAGVKPQDLSKEIDEFIHRPGTSSDLGDIVDAGETSALSQCIRSRP